MLALIYGYCVAGEYLITEVRFKRFFSLIDFLPDIGLNLVENELFALLYLCRVEIYATRIINVSGTICRNPSRNNW